MEKKLKWPVEKERIPFWTNAEAMFFIELETRRVMDEHYRDYICIKDPLMASNNPKIKKIIERLYVGKDYKENIPETQEDKFRKRSTELLLELKRRQNEIKRNHRRN